MWLPPTNREVCKKKKKKRGGGGEEVLKGPKNVVIGAFKY